MGMYLFLVVKIRGSWYFYLLRLALFFFYTVLSIDGLVILVLKYVFFGSSGRGGTCEEFVGFLCFFA